MKQQKLSGRTIRLFDEDAYIRSFDAEVISCEIQPDGSYSVILDKTAFFPEAGGQPSDTGVIICCENGMETAVFHVAEKNGEIIHYTKNPVPCGEISGRIDFGLRYERMRNHTGEHILSGLAHRMYSCTNVGFHLNDETVTVDLDKQLTAEQLNALEAAINDIIAENLSVKAYYPAADMLPELEYRSKLELTENVRIVEIGEGNELCDRCACCAPHVAATSEVGMLIITDSINYKGGTRLNMVCGKNAYKLAKAAYANAKETGSYFSAKALEASEAVRKFLKKTDEERGKNAALCNAYIELKLSQLEPLDGNIILFEPNLDKNALRRLVDRGADICTGICAGFTGSDDSGYTYIMISRTCDLKAASKTINELINGRGGGSSQMIQGTAMAHRAVIEAAFIENLS